jgi:cyclopropane fatty-acyl-phospholipid synthase-like methyltransferase
MCIQTNTVDRFSQIASIGSYEHLRSAEIKHYIHFLTYSILNNATMINRYKFKI